MHIAVFFYFFLINIISNKIINGINIKEKILKHHKNKNQSVNIKINRTEIKNIIIKSNILSNNLNNIEKSLLKLIVEKNNNTFENLIENQILTKEFIKFFSENKFNIDVLNYDPKILEEIFENKLDKLDNKKIINILNNVKDLFNKIKLLLNIINNTMNISEITNNNITFLKNFIQNNFKDIGLNDTVYFINNSDKLNNSICFNKKTKLKYLICIYKNFNIFSELIYNYYIIVIKLKLAYNVISSQKKYSYTIIKKSISKEYIKKINSYKKRKRKFDKFIFITQKNKNIKILHYYFPDKNQYNKIKKSENIILGSVIGVTINNI